MKGRSLRPRIAQINATLCLTQSARIVPDPSESAKDRFMPLDVAKQMYAEGKLTEIDLGPEYPNSYMVV